MTLTVMAPRDAARPATTRRLSGFKPTGRLQLGNYLGAVRPMIESQRDPDPIILIANLHA